MNTIPDRLAQLRDRSGLSLRAFAEAVEKRTGTRVLHDSARRYESGETRIPAEYVVAVCQAFGVSAEWLLLGVDPPVARERSLVERAFQEVSTIVEQVQALEGHPATSGPMIHILNKWERFTRGLPPTHPLREVILRSWTRSQDAGVDPTAEALTLRRVHDADLERRRDMHRELLRAAELHLAWLSAATGDLPHVVYLVCADGIVLHATESTAGLADGWGLRPGTDWSEAAMGTNGAGTAVVSGNVVAVLGPEHYVRGSHGSTCLAAPIRDSRGMVIGAIDLSTRFIGWRPHQLVFVAYCAQMIERDLALRSDVRSSRSRAGGKVGDSHGVI